MVTQQHGFVLCQGPDPFVAAGRQDDVAGRILVAQPELAQGAEGGPQDAPADQAGGYCRVGDVAVATPALGVDEVLGDAAGDVGEQQRALHGGVPAEPDEEAELGAA
ncbi:hypothetical protein AB0F07_39375 [Streptomyces fructofermentans]|uniref:hypothetical protein n=1 Tax=Streptomyces fructofermentans TaxID=152141 RepID=UPI00340F9A37